MVIVPKVFRELSIVRGECASREKRRISPLEADRCVAREGDRREREKRNARGPAAMLATAVNIGINLNSDVRNQGVDGNTSRRPSAGVFEKGIGKLRAPRAGDAASSWRKVAGSLLIFGLFRFSRFFFFLLHFY